jgi:hypothetical protein
LKTKSEMQVEQNLHLHIRRKPWIRSCIRSWQNKFLEMGSVDNRERSSRPCMTKDNVWRISEAFQRSPSESTWAAAAELQLPWTTVHRVLLWRLLELKTWIRDVITIIKEACWIRHGKNRNFNWMFSVQHIAHIEVHWVYERTTLCMYPSNKNSFTLFLPS